MNHFVILFLAALQSDNGSKGTDTETEVEVSSTSSDTEVQNVPLKEIASSRNAPDGPSLNVANKSSTCPCQMRMNAFGQVKTARNTKRPKPPLPPMKKKKGKPTRFSQRLKSKQNEPNKVFRYMPLFNIYFNYLDVTCSLSF